MINPSVLKEINELSTIYEARFGKDVDYMGLPSTVSQSKLLQAFRIIVNTGDSLIIGLKKVRDLTNPYFDYLTKYHNTHIDLENGFVFDKPCPLCNGKVYFYEFGTSYMYKCETKNCLMYQFRGI